MDKIIIGADGGCSNNGKENSVGGYGAIIQYKGHTKEIYGGELNTTNQRMEILSVIKPLELITDYNIPVEIYSDSQYVVSAMNDWIDNWQKNGWKTSQKKPVENQDLWKQLLTVYNKYDNINIIKVKGHSGNEFNEKADQLAQRGIKELKTIT